MLMQPITSPPRRVGGTTRRDELDLLRALIVVGLVFFHTAVIFAAGEFPIKAGPENRAATVLLAFGAVWGMPLLFLAVRTISRVKSLADAAVCSWATLRLMAGLRS